MQQTLISQNDCTIVQEKNSYLLILIPSGLCILYIYFFFDFILTQNISSLLPYANVDKRMSKQFI